MFAVTITLQARKQLLRLPSAIQARIAGVFERLADWPSVSGAKPLRHELKGNYRIRTGDYRILFAVNEVNRTISVWKIGDRRDVYED
jgi:mRNA interferase RelE/StbE